MDRSGVRHDIAFDTRSGQITQDTDARGAFDNARDLAAHAERWGYRRFWIAEHHNMPGIASAATSVVIGHIAAGTKTIRVGAGGIMLPNHGRGTAIRRYDVPLFGGTILTLLLTRRISVENGGIDIPIWTTRVVG